MIIRKDMDVDLDNMTIGQIKVYVEKLKETIYHMAETLETISSSYKMVERELKEFSGLSINNKTSIPKNNVQQKETIEPVQEEKITYAEDEMDYGELMTNKDEEENMDEGNYIIIFTYTFNEFNDENEDKVIISPDGKFYTIMSEEGDTFAEIESMIEYLPYYYFHNIPNSETLYDIWNTFCENIPNNNFKLKEIYAIDQNKGKIILKNF